MSERFIIFSVVHVHPDGYYETVKASQPIKVKSRKTNDRAALVEECARLRMGVPHGMYSRAGFFTKGRLFDSGRLRVEALMHVERDRALIEDLMSTRPRFTIA